MQGEPRAAEGAAFAQALSALKQRGSNLLVVGAGLNGCHRAACDRLLGESTGPPRRRLQVRTDGRCGVRSSGRIDVELVAGDRSTTRSAAAPAPAPAPGESARGRIVTGDVADLGAAVIEEIEAVEADADGLSPAEFRVCFDSLLPLLGGGEGERTFRMLTAVTKRVRAVDGMGHFHLPVAPGDEHVATLEPLFDAVITVRSRDGRHEHRWRLVEDDVASGWLPL